VNTGLFAFPSSAFTMATAAAASSSSSFSPSPLGAIGGPGSSLSAGQDSCLVEMIEELKRDHRTKLLDLFDEMAGRKALLLDSTIVGPLDSMFSSSDLKDHGVTTFIKISEQPATLQDCSQMIFLMRSSRVDLIDCIARQILADEGAGHDRNYLVVFVPHKTDECIERLARSNVQANVKVAECAIHFFPLDRDVLSLELPGVLADFHVNQNPSGPYHVAQALMHLQSKFGAAPTVHVAGQAAKVVHQVISRLRKEDQTAAHSQETRRSKSLIQPGVPPCPASVKLGAAAAAEGNAGPQQQPPQQVRKPLPATLPGIDEMIILDRRVDLYSVLCSQFTYQALIDMVFGITNQSVNLGQMSWAKSKSFEHVRLSSEEALYRDIRDLHIDKIGRLLQEWAQEVSRTYAEKDNIKRASEMSEYVKQFKTAHSAHSLLEIHINLASSIRDVVHHDDYRQQLKLEDEVTAQNAPSNLMETLEDKMDDLRPFEEVMRLLCLHSLVNNGVRKKELDNAKKVALETYGFEHLLTLCNMEKVGLLRYQQGRSAWANIKQKFNLFAEEDPISYAFSGYVPLSVRLVQMTKGRGGWKGCRDTLNLLWGTPEEHKQPEVDPPEPGRPLVSLVVFIGGLTYGEMAAIRKLSETEGNRKFLVLTTEMLNAKKLFNSLRYEGAFHEDTYLTSKAKPQAAPVRSGFGFWPGGR